MKHTCPTGFHQTPSRRCYWHGCRCDRCLDDHTTYQADMYGRTRTRRLVREQTPEPAPVGPDPATTRATVDVPRRPWERIQRTLHTRGMTVDEWLWGLSDKIERTVL